MRILGGRDNIVTSRNIDSGDCNKISRPQSGLRLIGGVCDPDCISIGESALRVPLGSLLSGGWKHK